MSTNTKNIVIPKELDLAVNSSRRNKNNKKSSSAQLSMSDFMGIKKSDSIDNFYEIDKVIGRGAFGEVVKARHLFSNEERAIKIIEKHKLS
jgi:serine/threonine protein kinase